MSRSVVFDLVLAAVFAAAVIFGAKKGAFRAVSGLLGMVLGFWAAQRFVSAVQPVIESIISPFVRMAVNSAAQKSGVSSALGDVLTLTGELAEKFGHIAEALGLTPEFSEGILNRAHDAGATMQSALVDGITGWIAPLVSFALIFIAVQICVAVLCNVLSSKNIPVISTINALGGALLGAVYGIAAIVVISWAVLAFAPAEPQGFISQPIARESFVGSIVSSIVE